MITFHDLYERYAADVYRFAYWLTGHQADAEDITSETFVRAWVGRERIQVETVKAYLLTIARHLYLKQWHKAQRWQPLSETELDRDAAPETQVAERLTLEQVRQLLQALPEVDRTVFLLHAQHELPYTDIAQMTGVTVAAAKVKVHRVRLKLAASGLKEMV